MNVISKSNALVSPSHNIANSSNVLTFLTDLLGCTQRLVDGDSLNDTENEQMPHCPNQDENWEGTTTRFPRPHS